jgi:hypothetical protein
MTHDIVEPATNAAVVKELPRGRVVPKHAQRWGWWTVGWAVIIGSFMVLEGVAIWVNQKRGGFDDFEHRTLSENLWAVFAYHPDDIATAKFGKVRRLLFQWFMAWFDGHIKSNGQTY